ncbi:S-layer homology domain-containing protein [Paenibacillus sp. 1_12]|uniref:S-layer homology domain-containing protein n=1 Tax=Paenibacillus sp. 1_12 TaxID=1566278 RepID=UPI0008DEB622|nr:S-layer homology domain-containing protein [Paenibacillus sp. 1_12]SFL88716.1 S-layer homology domain-containing protein [Paenibacillus sp. 1_12]
MSASSYNPSKQNSKKPKDIRGGELKVMKKSLSTILSLAMAFSMFSSVALAAENEVDATKSSADFKDLKDLDAATKVKFDALISAGVFDGVKEGEFGLKEEMNRAQFAKVAALIFGLKVDTTLKTSTFTDVKSDDPANGYAVPYIEAVKAAGITDGYAPGQYNPAGKVTKEQLATFLIRGLNKDAAAKATPGVTDATVSDWAKGYVALALQLKLLSNGTDGKFGGTSNATRDLLVLGASEAKAQWKPVFNGKYAIYSLKATDANVLSLQLNGPLTDDAAKAFKLEIKKDGNAVTNYTTKWSDDKTTATLTFDSKFQNNVYAATISGVSNLDSTAATSSVTTTVERIAKIEFLSASETIARTTKKVRIDFKATNQYGAKSTLSNSNFQINSSSNTTISGISGEQAFYLSQDAKDAPNQTESKLDRNDRISITIIHEDSGVTANKVFAVGEAPFISKIEVGDLKNSSNQKIDVLEANKDTYLDFKAYDQYGLPVEDQATLRDGVSVHSNDGNLKRVATDSKGDTWFVESEIGTDAADLKFKYDKKESKDNVVINVIANGSGQTVTKTVKVTASKVPATIEFGSYNYTLANGDGLTNDSDVDQKMYVPIIVKDIKGDVLSADDIVDNSDKFTVYSSGGIQLSSDRVATTDKYIVKSGAHKGQIAIGRVTNKGNASITVQLIDNSNAKAVFSASVGEERKAEKIAFSVTPKKFQINGTDNELKFKIYDQHGSEFKLSGTGAEAPYSVALRLQGNPLGGLALKSNDVADSNAYIAAGATQAGVNKMFSVVPKASVSTVTSTVYKYNVTNNDYSTVGFDVATLTPNQIFDKSFKFFTDSNNATAVNGSNGVASAVKLPVATGAYTLYAELFRTENNKTVSVSTLNTTLEILDVNDSKNKLTYEAYLDKGTNNGVGSSVLAVKDYMGSNALTNSTGTVTGAAYVRANLPKLSKEVKVRAKNNTGEAVAVPQTISSVTSSNPLVLTVTPGTTTGFVTGLDAGTANLRVVYKDAKGDFQTTSVDVTTKNEGPQVASIALKNSAKTVARSALTTLMGTTNPLTNTAGNLYVQNAEIAEKITVKDQFSNEYVSEKAPGTRKADNAGGTTDQFVGQHQSVLNLTYYASDIVGTGTVTINASTGQITNIDPTVTGFTVNVIAPSGVSASTAITLN